MRIDPIKYQIAKARAAVSTTYLVENYGMRRATITRAARGKECRPETIGKIAKALNVDVLDIIDTQLK